MTRTQAEQKAQEISKRDSVVQHVNKDEQHDYIVSDWYDTDATVTSFNKGKPL